MFEPEDLDATLTHRLVVVQQTDGGGDEIGP